MNHKHAGNLVHGKLVGVVPPNPPGSIATLPNIDGKILAAASPYHTSGDPRYDGIFLPGVCLFDLSPKQWDELLVEKGVLGEPSPDWERTGPWDPKNPERVPDWRPKSTPSVEAEGVAGKETELKRWQQELETAILGEVTKPKSKFEVVHSLEDYDSADVSSALNRLVRSGVVRTKRLYRRGSGYATVYQR
jgi:hypothetical protein